MNVPLFEKLYADDVITPSGAGVPGKKRRWDVEEVLIIRYFERLTNGGGKIPR
jgi:hypothetical protein